MTWQDPGLGGGPGRPAGGDLQAGAPPPPPGPGSAPGYPPAPGFAPPAPWAPLPPGYGPAGAPGLVYASTSSRFVAWLVDVFILGLVGLPISLGATMVVFGSMDWRSIGYGSLGYGSLSVVPTAESIAGGMALAFLATLATTAIDLVYFALLWSSGSRATLGMRLLHLQIGTAASGLTLTRGQGAKRWLAMGSWAGLLSNVPVFGGLISLASLAWAFVLLVTTASSPTKQGLHDRIADTVIVRPAGVSDNAAMIGCLVILGFVVVGALIAIVALIFLGGQVSTILSTVGTSV